VGIAGVGIVAIHSSRRRRLTSLRVDDTKLNDGWWVDWPAIGFMRMRLGQITEGLVDIPPTPHMRACLGSCLTVSSYSLGGMLVSDEEELCLDKWILSDIKAN
jgi:hypothetical protein